MTDQPSPLGRYDEASDGNPSQDAEPLHEVRLLGVPVLLYVEGRQHHDDLLQELSVLAVSTEESGSGLPSHLADLVDALGRRYGTPTSRPDAPIDAAVTRGDSVVDLTYQVPDHVLGAADRLETLLARADELSRGGELLTMPRSEMMLRFSRWYLDEFRRQLSGKPPRPWAECEAAGGDGDGQPR